MPNRQLILWDIIRNFIIKSIGSQANIAKICAQLPASAQNLASAPAEGGINMRKFTRSLCAGALALCMALAAAGAAGLAACSLAAAKRRRAV